MLFPHLNPRFARRTADKDPRGIDALFVANSLRVAVMSGEAAVREDLICLVGTDAQGDDCARRIGGITSQPLGVGCADGFGEAICASQNFDRTVLPIVARG